MALTEVNVLHDGLVFILLDRSNGNNSSKSTLIQDSRLVSQQTERHQGWQILTGATLLAVYCYKY